MKYYEVIVLRIRQLCKQRGFSINRLATMSGVSQSTIDNLVRGITKNPKIITLHKLAIAFNMTPAEFLNYPALNDFSFEDEDDDGDGDDENS